MLKPTGGWGYHSDTELLFPMRVASQLRELRGDWWRDLVDRAAAAPDGSPEQLAFSLLLIRLNGCLTCHTDCHRAQRGCTTCAYQSIRRYRGTDADLAELHEQARQEVMKFLNREHVQLHTEVDGE
ncbi:MAG: hypothetical protein R3191_02230 [Anaerolineales bacterium]|nr:hypothetical protein [Anaerolineales bacterium]